MFLRRRLRVLYALPSYPHLSSSYMHNELLAVRRAGARVEVWSGRVPTAASDEVPVRVHTASIGEAIREFAPHVVHAHWLVRNEKVRKAARAAGLPMTVRAHGFDCSAQLIAALEADPAVRTIYLFPHQHAAFGAGSRKSRPLPPCIDPERYLPTQTKDTRCVVRAGVARPEQNHESFIRMASRLPGFRCVHIVCHGYLEGEQLGRLRALNEELGRPVTLHANLQYRQVAPLVAGGAIYLHTTSPDKPYGMPVSIAEAMATGSFVLTPDRPGASDYVGDAGATYRSEGEAVEMIEKTTRWSSETWREVRERSCRRAAAEFSGERAARTLLADWQALRG